MDSVLNFSKALVANGQPTLLLPLVSTGNVPQLTIDLMLHSLASEFQFIRALDGVFLHPFLGPLDHSLDQDKPILYKSKLDSGSKFSTALELFYNEEKNFYIIQQRTPIIQGYMNNFIKETILPLIMEFKIENVIVLDSFGVLDELNLEGRNFNSNKSNGFCSLGSCNINSINELTRNFNTSLNVNTNNGNNHSNNEVDWFKFTGDSVQQEISPKQDIFKFAYHLINSNLTTGSTLNEIKYLTCFVHEGDNSMDAKMFTEWILRLLNLSLIHI